MLLMAMGVWWIIEQPLGSCMGTHAALKLVQELATMHRLPWCEWEEATTFMGSFGGPTPKPHKLWCNKFRAHALTRSRPSVEQPSEIVKVQTAVDSFGDVKTAVTGRKDALKESQHYEDEFGFAVLDVYMEYQLKFEAGNDEGLDLQQLPVSTEAWKDLDSAAIWRTMYNTG